MVYRVLSLRIAPGKHRQAQAWIAKASAYVNLSHPGAEEELLTEIGGELGVVHVFEKFESLAAYEEWNAKVGTDSDWAALVDEGFGGEDPLLEASVKEAFFQTAPFGKS